MNSFNGTVSLIEFEKTYLAVLVSDTLTIGQSSDISFSETTDGKLGYFQYGSDQKLPAYLLDDNLLPSSDSKEIETSQFCVGLRTADEADAYVLVCQQFQQIDVSEETHSVQQLPSFMSSEQSIVDGVFEHQEKVYLITSPDKLLERIASNHGDYSQEVNDV